MFEKRRSPCGSNVVDPEVKGFAADQWGNAPTLRSSTLSPVMAIHSMQLVGRSLCYIRPHQMNLWHQTPGNPRENGHV
jgi:hypothetical protein